MSTNAWLPKPDQSAPAYTAKPQPLAVRLEQAAEMLSIAPSTLHSLADRGVVRSVRIGRARVFPVKNLQDFLDSTTAVDGRDGGPMEGAR